MSASDSFDLGSEIGLQETRTSQTKEEEEEWIVSVTIAAAPFFQLIIIVNYHT